jgi:hypothetical protein
LVPCTIRLQQSPLSTAPRASLTVTLFRRVFTCQMVSMPASWMNLHQRRRIRKPPSVGVCKSAHHHVKYFISLPNWSTGSVNHHPAECLVSVKDLNYLGGRGPCTARLLRHPTRRCLKIYLSIFRSWITKLEDTPLCHL